ncbi:hypothetical protein MferCBS31731_003486 [Microsporum ferrugineum]
MLLPAPLSKYLSSLKLLKQKWHSHVASRRENNRNALPSRLLDVFLSTWDLGFTSFGGPPVHFRILHDRFVEGKGVSEKWIDEQTYQELFAICQGLPGPGSTKLLFCIALLHAGFVPALVLVNSLTISSLPGAIGMYALSLGVQQISETLPAPVYPLLSGLNSSTVGIIALAAVQLAEKAINDKLTRILVTLGACAGLCYNALWYFPLLMTLGGITTVIWDGWLNQKIRSIRLSRRRRNTHPEAAEEAPQSVQVEGWQDNGNTNGPEDGTMIRSRRMNAPGNSIPSDQTDLVSSLNQSGGTDNSHNHVIRIRFGIMIVILFFASFISILVARGALRTPPLALNLFANMYLAGTVIFGGGPVVIPLLRSYVVDPGWVSGRDFLLGLAVIQAFPGPNFNFAVFLGALALQKSPFPTIFGAILGGFGIFFPGLTLAVAVQSFWTALRKKKWVTDFLRGVNATAVGLVFTAVYRLWEIGYLTPLTTSGQSLGKEPWWVVIAAVTYVESAWFGVPPPLAIVMGAILGLCWYGAVGQ